jgi:hypothetical protein
MTTDEKRAEIAAVQAIVDSLPTPGAKAWMRQYIAILQEDIAADGQARDSPGIDWSPVIQLAITLWPLIKKHWPAASIGAMLSAAVSWFISFIK